MTEPKMIWRAEIIDRVTLTVCALADGSEEHLPLPEGADPTWCRCYQVEAPSREVLPRVWVGDDHRCSFWWWKSGYWNDADDDLDAGDIFVPRSAPRPTINPAEMGSLDTCSEVDW